VYIATDRCGLARAKSPQSAPLMTNTTVVSVGREAPAFTARDDRGQQVSLADYKGHYVVLFFYPKDDTPG
jgi:cytochrome oxidase Cu insertion factor (SCO1/SenC/PrrC family)